MAERAPVRRPGEGRAALGCGRPGRSRDGAALIAWLAAEVDAAGQALTYREALAAANGSNPTVVRAAHAADGARARELSARGAFDPLLGATATWASVAFDDVRDALPISGDDRTWAVATSLTGTMPTGTAYALSLDAGFDRSFATGLQPVYDTAGRQVGTAPYEAALAVYEAGVSATLSQQLLRGVRTTYNLQAVRLARDAWTVAELEREHARQQALADAATAYWTWAHLHELHQLSLEAVAVADEGVRVADEQLRARRLAAIDHARFEEALVLAQGEAATAEVLAQQARDALLVVMGASPGGARVPATPPGDPPRLTLDAEAVAAVAVAQNLDLAIARAAVQSRERVVETSRHGRLPSLEAFVTAGRTTGNQPTLDDAVTRLPGASGQPNLTVGAILGVTLWNRDAVGAARTAEADRLAAESVVRELEAVVRAATAHRVAQLEAAGVRVGLADRAVAIGLEVLATTEALITADRAVARDVLEARAGVARARVDAARARMEWRLAHTDLLRLQATLTEELP